MICPRHDKKMKVRMTQYGNRYFCPIPTCTVVGWEGSTSTPADVRTRKYRMSAHDHFDALWKSGIFKRGEAYTALAKHLGIKKKDCHIGMFDYETCLQVIDFARNIRS